MCFTARLNHTEKLASEGRAKDDTHQRTQQKGYELTLEFVHG